MTTAPTIDGHHIKWHTTDPADMPPVLQGEACPTKQMWESVTVVKDFSYSAKLHDKMRASLAPVGSAFKPFTAFEMLAKVREYIKAAWIRNELGFWQLEQGAICFMGGVYRFLVFEASNGKYSPHDSLFQDAVMTSKPLTEGLRTFALVVEEQFPQIPKLLPIAQADIQTLSNYIIAFNDRYAHSADEICVLLEKAMVRELERV